MILRTGNKGFTLVEVMLATCVLSLGAVLIYESFFSALESYNYCADYLEAAPWMGEKIWQAQDNLRRFGAYAPADNRGEFALGNKNFKWELSYRLINPQLYQIDLTLFWQAGRRRKIKLSRSAYAIHEE